MSNFQVGDVCEIVRNWCPPTAHLTGRECTIVSIGPHVCCMHKGMMGNCGFDCHVTVAGEGYKVFCCEFVCLRKKRPPGEVRADRQELGDWGQCPWRPARRPDDAVVDEVMRAVMKELFNDGGTS